MRGSEFEKLELVTMGLLALTTGVPATLRVPTRLTRLGSALTAAVILGTAHMVGVAPAVVLCSAAIWGLHIGVWYTVAGGCKHVVSV